MNTEQIEKMRKGRRIKYLKQCIKVQELLEQHETQETTRNRIFETYIKPVIGCSYTAFNKMLNEPNPKKQIDLLT